MLTVFVLVLLVGAAVYGFRRGLKRRTAQLRGESSWEPSFGTGLFDSTPTDSADATGGGLFGGGGASGTWDGSGDAGGSSDGGGGGCD